MEAVIVTGVISQTTSSLIRQFLIQEIERRIAILAAQEIAKELVTVWIPIIGWVLTGISVVYVAKSISEMLSMIESVKKGDTSKIPKEILQKAKENALEVSSRNKDRDDGDDDEKHLPWEELEPYNKKGKKIKTGKTNKNREYFYERDFFHNDVEVYKRGRTPKEGIHVGSIRMEGGKIYKDAVPNRKIEL